MDVLWIWRTKIFMSRTCLSVGPMRGGFSRYMGPVPEDNRRGMWISEGPHCLSHRRFNLIFSFGEGGGGRHRESKRNFARWNKTALELRGTGWDSQSCGFYSRKIKSRHCKSPFQFTLHQFVTHLSMSHGWLVNTS
jgi:hypothetical protein